MGDNTDIAHRVALLKWVQQGVYNDYGPYYDMSYVAMYMYSRLPLQQLRL